MIEIGVDFGGTKIEVAALDANGEFLVRMRAPNPGEYDAAIAVVCSLVAEAETRAGSVGTVGIGTPGSVSARTGLMRNSNSVWLNGKPFRADLCKALGREIRTANDANCLALSEAVDGAAAGSNIVFAAILGTGCGGGLFVNGGLIEGANGIAGEWGHTPLPWPKKFDLPFPNCWCGRSGCLETWISGSGLQRDAREQCGMHCSSEEIIELARAGDVRAVAAFERYVDRLGRAFAMLCNILDPEVIVLGGGLSRVPELYQLLPDAMRPYIFSDEWAIRIVPPQWGDSSGVRGAARLWRS